VLLKLVLNALQYFAAAIKKTAKTAPLHASIRSPPPSTHALWIGFYLMALLCKIVAFAASSTLCTKFAKDPATAILDSCFSVCTRKA
jgi:hypothetical protein